MVPTQNAGLQQQGRVWAGLGIQLLEKSLPLLGATSEEGQSVSAAIAKLGARFGKPPAEVGRAAVKQMAAALDPAPRQPDAQVDAYNSQMRAANRPAPPMGAA